ncbi:hypothetical protein GCM10009846_27160 [Agrococcus versicolor]|uniref:Polyketide cyclase n=1 Tax=Agrococcus versicolor TaxID=501482 RepID=A0ABP5MME3_9MICO
MPADLRFRTVWQVDAEPEVVRAALVDVGAYPSWWSSVLEVEGDEGADRTVALRGPLPAPLRIRVSGLDASDGVVAARLHGDVLGWCSWHLSTAPAGGTRAVMQQHVMLQRRSLRALVRVAPRRLRSSHAALMRAGEAGLRSLLAG